MRLLDQERQTCERFLPGLDGKLAAIPLLDLESPGGPGIELFRAAGGPGLLIPAKHNGGGATAVDAVRVTRALAARSPSLAVATTMHQFSLASLVALAEHSTGFEWMLLDGVATDQRLMASGFAEGRTAQGILAPTMKGVWDGTNWRISGRKQPCSLSRSMDLLTASVALEQPDGSTVTAIAMIPAASPGISVTPFWGSWALAGAESDTLILEDVEVHPDLIVELRTGLDGELDDLQTLGFVWFELLVTACYLGTVMALVERVLDAEKGTPHERLGLAMAVEGAALTLDGAARNLDEGDAGNDGLARALITRFTIADTIRSTAATAVELLGGMAYIRSSEVAYLSAAVHAIGFHPPSRHSSADALLGWFSGRPVVLD
ncbi:acyl-CoA dehydrogenase family protein [Crossiella cryophila]|uniref:Alkylation response protein AidB-like acyl-CoA dehydrogenase n=1 Tax=Crossiella cryophila TaxID=43355 RepID=A0A7W7CHV0_9PSEU|nr:acyl-CoA dehydrogenase family protein [Crossiella cryophila]MBB4681405.1 alkylation response protein AidB-like acyl-CoA dehydrogenase [Crossiella cryophila]